mgnify:FL=1
MKRKEMLFVIGALLICSVFLLTGYIVHNKKESNSKPNISLNKNNNFDYKFLKQIEGNDNTLVSPLSMAYLLSMIQSGAKGNTLNELNIALDNYDLQPMENIDSKISMANSMWINNKYKNDINNTFATALKINYHSEVLYDEFINADNINKWVSEKTYNMINELFPSDSVNSVDTIMALVNAIGINFKWDEEFDCNKTTMGNFLDKNVYMMNSNEKYLESDYYTGFIKDYEKLSDNSQYEFIGLLPKKDIQDVINNISNDVIKNSITESKAHIQIPRFKYEYNVNNVKGILESLGIKDMFNKEKANFGGIAEDIFVSSIVQKTYIDFMESGTKAAASSGGAFDITSAAEEKEVIFNKPFVYLIRKKGSNNIYFIGIVNTPIEYDETKDVCEG